MLYCVSIVMFLMASLCVALSRLSCAYPYPNEHIRCFFWQLHCMYRCVHVYACQILPYSTVSNHDTIVHCTYVCVSKSTLGARHCQINSIGKLSVVCTKNSPLVYDLHLLWIRRKTYCILLFQQLPHYCEVSPTQGNKGQKFIILELLLSVKKPCTLLQTFRVMKAVITCTCSVHWDLWFSLYTIMDVFHTSNQCSKLSTSHCLHRGFLSYTYWV